MNNIVKILGMAGMVIITSLFFFPFVPRALPMANTKMVLAAIGLVWAVYDAVRKRDATLGKDFITLSVWAVVVSLIGVFSIVYNDTPDTTYATYIVSMWVWLGGAYAVVALIRAIHGHASVRLVSHYLIAVCVAQCILAFTMDQLPALKNFIDSLMISEGYMGKVNGRLYGLGASLDVAGMRFAAVLVIITACMITPLYRRNEDGKEEIISWANYLYVLAFIIIAVIGNMIGRTATVGIGFALIYLVIATILRKEKGACASAWRAFVIVLLVTVPAIVYLYNTNYSIHENLRFGFEGFFSLWEQGKWETKSNNMLQHMVVFPEEFKTWIIGDGYFDGPSETDYYYTGPVNYGFYKHTDIGYLRFIFYFGLVGTVAFIIYMFKAGQACIRRFPKWAMMFLLILLLNYTVWFKVASDLFSVFALYLCIRHSESETESETATT